MEKYLKNPIILAIIVGAVIYLLMTYFYNPEETEDKSSKKSKKSKKKKKSGFFTDKRETTILVSAIAALGTWFLAKTYLTDSTETNLVDISGMDNGAPQINPLVNSLLGQSAASNEAGILNGQQFHQPQPLIQPMGQPSVSMSQPGVQPVAQSMIQAGAQPMGQPMAQPMAQPVVTNPAIQRVQNAAAELTNNLDRTNLNPVQQGGGGHRSYNLIGTGLDIPRSAIPKVLVDYN
jgi:hypothetical protein